MRLIEVQWNGRARRRYRVGQTKSSDERKTIYIYTREWIESERNLSSVISRADRAIITLLRCCAKVSVWLNSLWPLRLSLISNQLERVYLGWFLVRKSGAGIRRCPFIELARSITRLVRSIKSRCWKFASSRVKNHRRGNLYRGRQTTTDGFYPEFKFARHSCP